MKYASTDEEWQSVVMEVKETLVGPPPSTLDSASPGSLVSTIARLSHGSEANGDWRWEGAVGGKRRGGREPDRQRAREGTCTRAAPLTA